MRLPLAAALLALLAAPALARGPHETFLISTSSGSDAGLAVPLGRSFATPQAMTQTGRFVAFTSSSDGLSAEDDDRFNNVFVRDTATGELILVSKDASGVPARAHSRDAAISDSESPRPVVAFASRARLTPDDTDDDEDVFVRDLQAGTIELVSRASGAGASPGGTVLGVTISGDGTTVGFSTTGSLDAADTDIIADVYTRDLASDVTTWESRREDGGNATRNGTAVTAIEPSLHVTGDYIAFLTAANDIADPAPTDTNNTFDVVVRTRATGDNVVASMPNGTGTTTANGFSSRAVLAGTGTTRIVVWDSIATNMATTPSDTDPRFDVFRREIGTTVTTIHSIDSSEAKGTGDAVLAGVDRAGDVIAFTTESAFDPADTNGTSDAYVRTPSSGGFTTLVGRAAGVSGATGAEFSEASGMSPDGTAVAFATAAPEVVPGAGEPYFDGPSTHLVRRKAFANTTISTPADGATSNAGADASVALFGHFVSTDGRYVVFESEARGLAADDLDPVRDVFRRDTLTGQTVLVSRATGAAGAPGDGSSFGATISADGQRVAFLTQAGNLGGDLAGITDPVVYVRDLATGTTIPASRADGAAGAVTGVAYAVISGNGNRVAFATTSDLGEGDGGGALDAFVRDIAAARTFQASVASGTGADGNGLSSAPVPDFTGNRVAFRSSATNLADGDGDTQTDLHVHDFASGATLLASTGAAGKANDSTSVLAISDDGQRVAFDSNATNLDPVENDDNSDVFVRDLATSTASLASRGAGAGPAFGGQNSTPHLSRDGRSVAFLTSGAAIADDTAGTLRSMVRRLDTGAVEIAGRATGVDGALPDSFVSTTDLDGDGSCAAFVSTAGNLISTPISSDVTNVWMRVLGASCPDPAPVVPVPLPMPPVAGPVVDAPPVLSGVSFTRKRFGVARAATPLTGRAAAKRAPKGSTLRFRVSEAGTVTIAGERATTGRRVGSSCRKATRKLRKRKRCTRYVVRGTLRRTVGAGARRVAFSGRIGRKALARGRYRVSLRATDSAGQRSAVKRASFTIAR